MRPVRSARRAGEWRSFRNSVSVSAASMIACFQLSCTGDSAADTMPRAHLHPFGAERERGGHAWRRR